MPRKIGTKGFFCAIIEESYDYKCGFLKPICYILVRGNKMQQDSKQLIKGLPRRIALMLLDCGLIVVCYWLAVMLRFDSGDAYRRVEILRAMAPMLLYVLPI